MFSTAFYGFHINFLPHLHLPFYSCTCMYIYISLCHWTWTFTQAFFISLKNFMEKKIFDRKIAAFKCPDCQKVFFKLSHETICRTTTFSNKCKYCGFISFPPHTVCNCQRRIPSEHFNSVLFAKIGPNASTDKGPSSAPSAESGRKRKPSRIHDTNPSGA